MIDAQNFIAPYIWQSGQLLPWQDAKTHVTAIGHGSVSSVFEGIRGYFSADTGTFHLVAPVQHYERLLDSANLSFLSVDFSADNLLQATLDLINKNEFQEDIYIRPWTYLSGFIREQIAPQIMPCEVIIDCWPLASKLSPSPPVQKACVSSWIRGDDRSVSQKIKCFSNYNPVRLATIEAKNNGFDWPIFQNNAFHITESSGAGLAIVSNNVVIFPPLISGVLDSITRKIIIHLCEHTLQIPVVISDLERTDLYLADEAFFFGTGWEILPLGMIDSFTIGDGHIGEVTQSLVNAYQDIVRGRAESPFIYTLSRSI